MRRNVLWFVLCAVVLLFAIGCGREGTTLTTTTSASITTTATTSSASTTLSATVTPVLTTVTKTG